MKIDYFFLFGIVLALASCRKTERVNEEAPVLHQVVFNVNAANRSAGGNIEDGTISAEQAGSLSDRVKCLSYYIFNSSGTLVKSIKQASGAAAFGLIIDSVAAGTYTLVFIGSQTDVGISGPSSLSTARIVDASPQQDLFFKKASLTVGDDDFSQDVIMGRIEGYFQISADDILPDQVASVELLLKSDYQSFSFASASVLTAGGTTDKRVNKVLDDAGRKKLTMGMFVMNNLNAMSSTITFYDSGNKVLKTVAFDNIRVAPNEKTMVSGKLYTVPSGGFSVGVDDAWADSVLIKI